MISIFGPVAPSSPVSQMQSQIAGTVYEAFLFQQGQYAGYILLSYFEPPEPVFVWKMIHALKEHVVKGHLNGNPFFF